LVFYEQTSNFRQLGRNALRTYFVKAIAMGNQIKENEMDGTVARMGEMRNSYKIVVGKPEGKRSWKT
jgi:hypothetical protein